MADPDYTYDPETLSGCAHDLGAICGAFTSAIIIAILLWNIIGWTIDTLL